MPAGRPSTYDRKHIEPLLELAAEGKSLAQISARLDIPRTTLLRWGDDNEEFRTALTRAKDLEQNWWEDQAQENLTADKFNAPVWKKSMEARFRKEYTERKEITGDEGGPIQTESVGDTEIARQIAFTLAKGIHAGSDDAI
ncbi:MAG: helix-turn-helix domain-containing protein [Paracoccaceae bacterium]